MILHRISIIYVLCTYMMTDIALLSIRRHCSILLFFLQRVVLGSVFSWSCDVRD